MGKDKAENRFMLAFSQDPVAKAIDDDAEKIWQECAEAAKPLIAQLDALKEKTQSSQLKKWDDLQAHCISLGLLPEGYDRKNTGGFTIKDGVLFECPKKSTSLKDMIGNIAEKFGIELDDCEEEGCPVHHQAPPDKL